MKKTIQFEGKTYIQKLHGIPDYYAEQGETNAEDWYWLKGSKKNDLKYLNKKWIDTPITSKDNLK